MANAYFLPIVAWTAGLVALAASVALVVLITSIRNSIGILRDEITATATLSEKVKELEKQLDETRARVSDVEQRTTPAADWSSEPGSVNLNRRGQVLRLYRRGESSSQIASALGLSQGEVRLIVKVHELTRSNAEAEKSEERTLMSRKIFDTNTRGRA